ncbi:hypothetical protein M3Y95_00242300 [Aphelenchoides besseyi]|nr:hypothetical protein M3Y95_00242300 [Aphelenchoides besseyi]
MCALQPHRKIACKGVLYPCPISGFFDRVVSRYKNWYYGSYFVLCLHKNIPLLECYKNSKEAERHEPISLHDLIGASAFPIEPRVFVVFFNDDDENSRPSMRYKTRNQNERDKWIYAINGSRINHSDLLSIDDMDRDFRANIENANEYWIIRMPSVHAKPPLSNSAPTSSSASILHKNTLIRSMSSSHSNESETSDERLSFVSSLTSRGESLTPTQRARAISLGSRYTSSDSSSNGHFCERKLSYCTPNVVRTSAVPKRRQRSSVLNRQISRDSDTPHHSNEQESNYDGYYKTNDKTVDGYYCSNSSAKNNSQHCLYQTMC